MKKVFVLNVDIVESDRPTVELAISNRRGHPIDFDHARGCESIDEALAIEKEVIKGRVFGVNGNGHKVIIGWSNQAQDAIGIPFDAFNSLQADLEKANDLYAKLLTKVSACGLWGRIRYALTGRLP